MHVLLRISERNGEPDFEPVHVHLVSGNRYQLLFSPGLAYGIAAGDEIELESDGSYTVLARGGNFAVRFLCASGVASIEESLTAQVAKIGGRLDGRVRNGLSYTIPVGAGREAVRQIFAKAKRETPGALWEYGNVYDENGQLMGWLRSEA